MKIRNFDTNKKVLVVAEIGNNHEGFYSVAEDMIVKAAKAGVDAVKFQTFRTELFVNRSDKIRFNRLKSFELTFDEFEKLSQLAISEGLLFLSTPFDLESAKFLNTIVSAYKISSSDNNFYPLIKVVSQTGKPIIMSSGLADLEQIRYSKDLIENIWRESGIKQSLAVLHCVASYPVESYEARLAAIRYLKEELKCTIGYTDHTLGIEAAVISVALGARIVEKHFTLDKNYSDFRDHKLSADPEDMKELVLKVNDVVALLGEEKKGLQDSEKSSLELLRRSIVASHDLSDGVAIGWDDIMWTRPAGGLSPGSEHLILGRKLNKPVKMGEPITIEMLSDCIAG